LSYLKTVAVAIGLVLCLLVFRSIVAAIRPIAGQHATGFAFVLGGAIEAVVASVALGWLAGTVWYLIRRR